MAEDPQSRPGDPPVSDRTEDRRLSCWNGLSTGGVFDRHIEASGVTVDDLPSDVFKEHVWVSPFPEEDVLGLVNRIGADRVLLVRAGRTPRAPPADRLYGPPQQAGQRQRPACHARQCARAIRMRTEAPEW